MESNFEELINSYLENNVGISEHFLSNDLVRKLKLNLLKLNDEKLLSAAGIGKTEKPNT
jgi:SM-20-related protein